MAKVGFQDGLKAGYQRIKKLDPAGCNPNYDPDNPDALPIDQLKAWDKVHRTLKIMKEDHDAAIPSNGGNGDEEPPPPDPHFGIAPRTYNYAQANNSDPLFCKNSPGVTVHADGSFSDKFSRYDSNGKDIDGLRDRKRMVPGLNESNNTNGLDPCTFYNGLTKWPDESYLR